MKISISDYEYYQRVDECMSKNKAREEKNRPYLEVKVVKVKKENEGYWCGGIRIGDTQYKVFKKGKGIPYLKEFKKGNWVNGENLDKIKFPCFCSYTDGEDSERKKGFLSMNRGYHYIANIENQKEILNDVTDPCYSLKEFITKYNIHILKSKIILFEEG